jgi:hypothetical protein
MKIIDERIEVETDDILTCVLGYMETEPGTPKTTSARLLTAGTLAFPIAIKRTSNEQEITLKIASNANVISVQDMA